MDGWNYDMSAAPRDVPVIIFWEGTVGEAMLHEDGWWWANAHGEYWAEALAPDPTAWQPMLLPPKEM